MQPAPGLPAVIISCTPIHRYARLPDTIAALVVDSAPVMADPRSVASVVEASTPPGWRRWLLARYIAASARLRGVDGGMQAYVANLRRLGWGKPQLFLYSRDDPIARADKVGACVECGRGRHGMWEVCGAQQLGFTRLSNIRWPFDSVSASPLPDRSTSWLKPSLRWGKMCGPAAGRTCAAVWIPDGVERWQRLWGLEGKRRGCKSLLAAAASTGMDGDRQVNLLPCLPCPACAERPLRAPEAPP